MYGDSRSEEEGMGIADTQRREICLRGSYLRITRYFRLRFLLQQKNTYILTMNNWAYG